jgi:hypothetical protein
MYQIYASYKCTPTGSNLPVAQAEAAGAIDAASLSFRCRHVFDQELCIYKCHKVRRANSKVVVLLLIVLLWLEYLM